MRDLAYLCGKGRRWHRPRRQRVLAWSVLTAAGLLSLALVTYAFRLDHTVESALGRAFQVDCVDVHGYSHLSALDVQALSAQLQGQPIWRVSPKAVQEYVASNGWIERAEVKRILPSRVEIRFHERQPVAVVYVPEPMCLGKDGTLLPDSALARAAGLPRLTGFSSEQIRSGGRTLTIALAVAETLQRSAVVPAGTVAEIHVDGDSRFWIRFQDEPVPVLFDPAYFDPEQVRLCLQVLGDLKSRDVEASFLDIRFHGQIVAVTEAAEGHRARLFSETG